MNLSVRAVPEFAGVDVKRGKLARLLDADADGINLRADRGGDLRGGDRLDLALVVVAVGQQNDDAAFAVLERLEPFGRGGGGVANGRAQFANDADVQAVQILRSANRD